MIQSQNSVPLQQEQVTYTQNQTSSAQQNSTSGGCKTFFIAIMRHFRWISLITALLLIAFGLLTIIYLYGDFLVSIFMGIYLILFGLFIVCAEFHWFSFLAHFPFLIKRFNRACFTIFCGTLCFAIKLTGNKWWPGICVGCWSCVIGIFYIIASFCIKNPTEEQIQVKFVEQFGSQKSYQSQQKTSA